MTVYELMTMAIESFTESTIDFEKVDGRKSLGCRGMIDGAKIARDKLSIEAAECEVL